MCSTGRHLVALEATNALSFGRVREMNTLCEIAFSKYLPFGHPSGPIPFLLHLFMDMRAVECSAPTDEALAS
jgi:hypothetical protein